VEKEPEVKKRDLWVDFNDVGPDSRVRTLMEYAAKNVMITLGDTVVVGDSEGNRCEAQVVSIRGDVVELALNGNAFRRPNRVQRPAMITS
jgi:hypothetical protein